MVYRDPIDPDRAILVVGINGMVYGLDRVTGATRWSNVLSYGGHGEVFVAWRHDVLVVSADANQVYRLDPLTGDTRWRAPTSGEGRATIVIEPDCIVVGKGSRIDCFDLDGHRLWSRAVSGGGKGHWRAALGFPGNVAQADEPGSS